jgi:hypothetical protein
MKFFFSGELDAVVADAYRPIRNAVERALTDGLGTRDYGSAVREIAIIPMILRPEFLEDLEERRFLRRREGVAEYRTTINLGRFLDGDERERTRLLTRNLVEAITDLTRKAGKTFQGDRLIVDVLEVLAFTREEVERA